MEDIFVLMEELDEYGQLDQIVLSEDIQLLVQRMEYDSLCVQVIIKMVETVPVKQ